MQFLVHGLLRFSLVLSMVLGVVLSLVPVAQATELPTAITQYLFQKDNTTQVRFDGLIQMAHGVQYLPVLPDNTTQLPTRVLESDPAEVTYPDIIRFDNGWFLLRLIPSADGYLLLPKRDAYPAGLKQGLLPQDLLMPPNLLIPSELRVLLGELPYRADVSPTKLPKLTPDKGWQALKAMPTRWFLSDIATQSVIAVNAATGKPLWKTPLHALPNQQVLSVSGQWLYVGATTTKELLVLDTHTNLIRARIALPEKPGAMGLLHQPHSVWVTHPYAAKVSVIALSNSGEPLSLQPKIITLPETAQGGGVVSVNNSLGQVWIADAYRPFVYVYHAFSWLKTLSLPLTTGPISAFWGDWPSVVTHVEAITADQLRQWAEPVLATPAVAVNEAVSKKSQKPAPAAVALDAAGRPRPTRWEVRWNPKPPGARPMLHAHRGKWRKPLPEPPPPLSSATTATATNTAANTTQAQVTLTGAGPVAPVGLSPLVSLSPYIWLASRNPNTLMQVSIGTGLIRRQFPLAGPPVALLRHGNLFYLALSGVDRVLILDTEAMDWLPSIALPSGSYPTGMVLSADKTRLYVCGAGNGGSVTSINLASGQIERVTTFAQYQPVAITSLRAD